MGKEWIIEPSERAWASPDVLGEKKDEKVLRLLPYVQPPHKEGQLLMITN